MRWFSYDSLALTVIATLVAVVFCVDALWIRRQLARNRRLEREELARWDLPPRGADARD